VEIHTDTNIGIIGASGFLGSHLLKYFIIENNSKPYVYVRKGSNLDRIRSLSDYFISVNHEEFIELLSYNKIGTVINSATVYDNKASSNFDLVYNCNVGLMKEVLSACNIKYPTRIISFDSFTSNFNNYPYLPLYHGTKRICREYANLFISGKSSNIEYRNIILYHLFGEFDNKNKFIPYVIFQLYNNCSKLKLTNGLQKRDFIYVKDVCTAIQKLIIMPFIPGYMDIELGTGKSTSIKEMVLFLKDHLKNTKTDLDFGAINLRENEVMDSKANIHYLNSIGWDSMFSLKDGLRDYV